MSASEVHAFLLQTAKKEKHHAFYKFMQSSEVLSIETRIDSSLTLKYFLVKTIVSQQVSTKAAQSIWQKVKIVLDKYQSRITLDILKEQGLSKPKASYILGIMQDQRIEKIAAVAVNITKVLVIIYLGLVEVFKIGKSLRKILVTESNSRKWASQTYSIIKRRKAKQKLAGV